MRLATRGGEREVRAEDFFVGDGMPVYTLAGSAMEAAAQAVGLRVVPEFFADRPLRGDGSVVMFRWWEAFEASPEIVASRAVRAATDRVVRALDGREVPVVADTICVHSDTPGAGAIGPAVRRALEDAGVTVTAEAGSSTGSPTNELGVKGVGEAGTIPTTAAAINAICDALAPLGIEHVDMPASPMRLWQLAHEGLPRG